MTSSKKKDIKTNRISVNRSIKNSKNTKINKLTVQKAVHIILFIAFSVGSIVYSANIVKLITKDLYTIIKPVSRSVDQIPAARFAININWKTGELTADASISRDDYKIEKYIWRIDDGSSLISVAPKFTHKFTTPGRYTIKLSVVDDSGQSDTAYCHITVPLSPDKLKPVRNAQGEIVSWLPTSTFFNPPFTPKYLDLTSPYVSQDCGTAGTSQIYNYLKSQKNEEVYVPILNKTIVDRSQKNALVDMVTQLLEWLILILSIWAIYKLLIAVLYGKVLIDKR